MPIYEYKCNACGHRLEAMQRMADEALRDCPECERPTLKKLISAAAFRLKGSGWYETDFKAGDKKNLADSGDAKPSGSKKEAKPAGKISNKPKSDKKSSLSTATNKKTAKKVTKKTKSKD